MGCNGSKNTQAASQATASTVLAAPIPAGDAAVNKPQQIGNLQVEVIEAHGLPEGTLPVCAIEVQGNEETRLRTVGATSCGAKAVWGSKLNLQGYKSGYSLRFTLWNPDLKTLLGEATLSSEQVRSGYLGDLVVSGSELSESARLRVNVDGSDATISEKLTHVVAEVEEVAQSAVANTTVVLTQAQEDLNKTVDHLQDELKEAAGEAVDLVEIESKTITCKC